MQLTIDPEFRDLLRPLDDEESLALEQSILSAGRIINKIVTWNGVIVDGHHRYAIALKYGVPFESEEMSFDSREDVLAWIVSMQSSRRNMNKGELAQLRFKMREMIGGGATMRKTAKKLGVPLAKVQREKAMIDAIDTLAPSVRDVAAGIDQVSPSRIRNIATMPEGQQQEVLEKIRSDPKKYRKLADLEEKEFSITNWNEKFHELSETVRTSLYHKNIPDCKFLTPDAKDNVVAYAEGLVAALEDCIIVPCPRCANHEKLNCKCCGGEGQVIRGISRMYGGRI